MKRWWLSAGKATISILLVAWILHSLDANALVQSAQRMGLAALSIATMLFILQAAVIGWRWHRIVHFMGDDLSAGQAFHWVFVGLFFNQALPSSVGGDGVRVWLLHRAGVDPRVAFASVAAERGTGVVIIGLMVTVSLPSVWHLIGSDALRLALLAIGPSLLAAFILLAKVEPFVASWLPQRLKAAFDGVMCAIRDLLFRPTAFVEIVGWGVMSALLAFLAAFVLGQRLGIDLALPGYIVLVGGATLLSVLPISLGGWGVREVGMVALFGAIGVERESALVLSVSLGIIPLLVSLPGGLSWWLGNGTALSGKRHAGIRPPRHEE